MTSSDLEASTSKSEYIGFWQRFVAVILDGVIFTTVTFPLSYWVYGIEFFQLDKPSLFLGVPDFLINVMFPLVATTLFWFYKSATPGKIALKAKIVDSKTGDALALKQCIIRNIGYLVALLPLGLGYLWIVWDPKKQGWHDKLAGTVVITNKR